MRTIRSVAAAALISLCSTAVGMAAEPIRLGMVIPVTGPLAESGKYALQGARLAADEVNATGGVLGRPLEIVVEDDQSTNPGTVLAFSKLVGRADIPVLLGPTRSTQIQAIAPDILKAGKPVMIGGTDPRLTKAGNPWLFRFRPNDTYTARVIADFGVKTLGKDKWAVIHATDAFGTSASGLFVEALAKAGVKPVLVQGSPNNTPDFTPVALAVKQSGADVMATFITFEADLAIFARQLRQLGVTPAWIGSPSTVTTTALNLAGPALFGSYAVADFNKDASPEARKFAEAYFKAFKTAPDFFASWPYDAVHILARAITSANGVEADKIRTAILAIRGVTGVEGVYNFDASGDGLHGYNIVKNDGGKIVLEKHIEFAD